MAAAVPPNRRRADRKLRGTEVVFETIVTNNGTDSATDIEVVNEIPQGMEAVPGSGDCFERRSGVVTCTLAFLIAGTSGTIDVAYAIPASAEPGTVLFAISTATSSQADSDGADNTVEYGATVTADADLTLEMVVSPDSVLVGNDIVYALAITNNGPSDARNVTVVDTLPDGLAFVSADEADAALDAFSQTVETARVIGEIVPGEKKVQYQGELRYETAQQEQP